MQTENLQARVEFSQRLNQLIDNLGITAYRFAKEIEVSEALISQLKGGKTLPNSTFLIKVLKKYKVNLRWLLIGEGLIFDGEKKELPALPSISKTELSEGYTEIPIIDIKAAATYNLKFKNPGYSEGLKKILAPSSILNGRQYQIFQYWGHSMRSTLLDGDYIVASYIKPAEWGNLIDNTICVIVTKRGIDIKRVKNQILDENSIRCRSDNQDNADYPPYTIDVDDILQLWEAASKLSFQLKNTEGNIYTKLESIESRLETLERKEAEQIKSKI